MPVWKHELKIKDLLKHDAEDHDAHAREIGPIAGQRVMQLAKRIGRNESDLAMDLEEIADGFEYAAESVEPKGQFNSALSDLYDLGDRHRIWIA